MRIISPTHYIYHRTVPTMKTTGRNIAVTMSNLLSWATTWVLLAVMTSLFTLAQGEDCNWTAEYWDHVVKKCAPCQDICEPLRGTIKQCYNQCEQYADKFLTPQLKGLDDRALTTLPPGGESEQPAYTVTTGLIVGLVAAVIAMTVIASLFGVWIGKCIYNKKSHSDYTSAPRFSQPENMAERGSLCPSATNNPNGSDSDFGSSFNSDQTLPKDSIE